MNAFGYFAMRGGLQLNARVQGRTAQPITASPRSLNGTDRGRNGERKDNAFFTFDWRLSRPFRFGGRYQLIPIVEMFNTFNNANNINPLSTPALFNFDGFLRTGVGDPRQVQLAVKLLVLTRGRAGDDVSAAGDQRGARTDVIAGASTSSVPTSAAASVSARSACDR